MGKKLTYESIKNYIDDEITGNGCKLSTTEEEFNQEKIKQNKNNSHVNLNLKCKCGNDFTKSYDAFKYSKKQCNKCSGLERPTIEYIKYFIEIESKSNCKLISTEYIDAHKLLELECSCGMPFKKNWNKFYSANQRTCNNCSNKLSGEKSKIPYEEIKNYIEIESKSGCELITSKDKYVDTNTDVDIKCKCGNYFQTTFHQFKSEQSKKRQCDECGNKARGIKLSKPYEEVKYIIESKGCKLITTIDNYNNVNSILNIECNCGNPFETSFSVFNREIGAKNKCDECTFINFMKLTKIPYIEVCNIFKNENCELLTTEQEYYSIQEDNKLRYKCSCGNDKARITLAKFKNGGRCRKCLRERVKNTNLKNNGVEYPAQNKEILAKQRQTMYKNGTAPCSRQQIYINQLIGGELNYPLRNLSLDIAFPEEMIYLEYDGGGHENNIIFGTMTKDDFVKRERNRTYGLLRSGWKEIRIISKIDNLPSDQTILEILSYARTYLKNHHYIKFDIDNNKIINSQGEFNYDFGELRKIKLTDLKEAI